MDLQPSQTHSKESFTQGGYCAIAGNGSQWSGMAQPLLRSSAVFRRAIEACAEAVRPHGPDLLAEFEAEGGWSQPALATVGLVAVQARSRAAGSTSQKMVPLDHICCDCVTSHAMHQAAAGIARST